MQSSIDVREVAGLLLEGAKSTLREDRSLFPTGVVLEASGKLTVVDLDLPHKQSAQVLRQVAQDLNAVAIFTITDSAYGVFPPEENARLEPIEDPVLEESLVPDGNERPCICMEIKIEGQVPTIVFVPYRKDDAGQFVFAPRADAPLDFYCPEPPDQEE